MKVTFVLPFAGLSGGVKVVAIYARLLSERGHEVTVVSQPPKRVSLRAWARTLIRDRQWIYKPEATPYLDCPSIHHIVLDENRPPVDDDLPDADVVIATWWETAEWVAALQTEKGRKFYLLQDYEVFPYLPVDRVMATYALPLRKIAVSEYIKKCIEEKHDIDDITTIANGVDLNHFGVPCRDRNTSPTVGFLYQLRPDKNIELALSVAQRAQTRIPGLQVIAFGAVPSSKSHPLPKSTEYHLRPEQSMIPQIYARCDVWLFTSTAEGFGLPILEAMASRTPVIGTDAGAAPDLIDGKNGFLVEPTVEAFMEKLEYFAKMDNETWQSFSEQARATAEAHTWDKATDKLERLLLEE